MYPKVFQNYPDTYYSTNLATTTVQNEYMPKWVSEIPNSVPFKLAQIIEGNGEIKNLYSQRNKISFDLSSRSKTLIQINTIYFPGWKVKVNGQKSPILYENRNGLIRFNVSEGEHKIQASFAETGFRLFADLISFISLLILLAWRVLPKNYIILTKFKL